MKNLVVSLGYFLIIILVATFLLTIFNYFNLLSPGVISVLKLVIPVVSIFITGYRLGKKSEKKGYLEGLKIGGLVILIFFLLVLLLDKFAWKSLLYYFILLLTSILSSMVGINRKKLNT